MDSSQSLTWVGKAESQSIEVPNQDFGFGALSRCDQSWLQRGMSRPLSYQTPRHFLIKNEWNKEAAVFLLQQRHLRSQGKWKLKQASSIPLLEARSTVLASPPSTQCHVYQAVHNWGTVVDSCWLSLGSKPLTLFIPSLDWLALNSLGL